jgi:formylglycine-generating enzyme required for sulfatase activity
MRLSSFRLPSLVLAASFGLAAIGSASCSSEPETTPDPNLNPTASGTSTGSIPGPPLPPVCQNGAKDADEADIDCGGKSVCPRCALGKNCVVGSDCINGECVKGVCQAATATDSVKNGGETGVDCGGPSAPACKAGEGCLKASDCASAVCKSSLCLAPSPTDGVKNGDESDVDCGGKMAPKCGPAKTCAGDDDCKSLGCKADKTCAIGRSCTNKLGGETCGAGEVDDAGKMHESCCTSLPITRGDGSKVRLDKYNVTSGRFRVFIEKTNGNIRALVKQFANWPVPPEFDVALPSTVAEAEAVIGPDVNPWDWPRPGVDPLVDLPPNIDRARGCQIANGGGRTYWTARTDAEKNKVSKDELEPKMMNCAPKFMFLAFCMWDGGDLPTAADLETAWGPAKYPWGASPDLPMGEFQFGFEFGVNQKNYQRPFYDNANPDSSVLIPPPGRKPKGNGPLGHADIATGIIPWVRDAGYVYTGSFEVHKPAPTPAERKVTKYGMLWNHRYWASGARCVRPM